MRGIHRVCALLWRIVNHWPYGVGPYVFAALVYGLNLLMDPLNGWVGRSGKFPGTSAALLPLIGAGYLLLVLLAWRRPREGGLACTLAYVVPRSLDLAWPLTRFDRMVVPLLFFFALMSLLDTLRWERGGRYQR